MSKNTSPSHDIADILQADVRHLWHHLKQHKAFEAEDPPVMVSGNGMYVTDIHGREFLDATAGGVWCVAVGYGRDRIANAVAEQLRTLPYFAGAAGNIPAIRLAQKLGELLPTLPKTYLSNSGSEANEKAFKITRQFHRLRGKEKTKVLYRHRDYHGTTLAALAASGQDQRKADYGPFPEGFVQFPHACCYRCPFDATPEHCDLACARAVGETIMAEGPDTVGAVIVEPITAGGGVIAPVQGYYRVMADACRKHGVLLIMDEVVCGFGRTGKMFGHQHYDVQPDMITVAKGLASAYMPLSATLATQEVFDAFLNDSDPMAFFRDISTYGGCAAACAAALENIAIIEEEELCGNSARMGAYLLDQLQTLRGLPLVGDIRGRGLFAGIELVVDRTTREPLAEAEFAAIMALIRSRGILVGRTNRSLQGFNNTLNLAPALIITRDQIDEIVEAIRNALQA
ncbi:MAG: aminotransferase class III-fold pyridoxal phosphate-dependent enzyme [Lentisphaerae bacterium]|nr:aminotransferase class III-fold pyridoxal phosphate-dependent enzyme [Lentisphaerota bacterium]MBT5612921.1 aminotransferase class III-fold pyridoxal phosphate-dependent enzyme [Lentisphaerota bacterium]MBT7061861.1 aminotransferase class III-fold pyridoxal phosphate-dependent enzyme [Lentisphaerota bacterium]MBT7846965.1 aminotransferase class III-fold pyridoxal phosphate-dependent enzyme [Lentisphaerota bacterium]